MQEFGRELQNNPQTPSAEIALVAAADLIAEAFRATTPMDPADVAARLDRLTEQMVAYAMRERMPVNHFFTNEMYAREFLVPAGLMVTGLKAKAPHIVVISRGECSILGDAGGMMRVRAPFTFVGKPGVRKCGYAHEDVVWTSVYSILDSGIDPANPDIRAVEDFVFHTTPEEMALLDATREF